jgi:hypothetical protein
MLVSSIVIIISTLHCGHDEWCVIIISVWCVFSNLLRPAELVNTLWKSDAILSPSNVRAVGCFVITAVPLAFGEAEGHHHCYSSDAAGVNSASPPNRIVTRHRLKDHHGWIVLQHNGDHALWPDGSYAEAMVMYASTQASHAPMRRNKDLITDGYHKSCSGVSAYPHTRVVFQYDKSKDLITDGW